jgi:hypothetical protein
MAYEKLTHFYSKWIDDIVDIQEELQTGVVTSFQFIHDYLTKLHTIFPQLKEPEIFAGCQ